MVDRFKLYQAAARAIGCTVTENTAGFISIHGPLRLDDWEPDNFDCEALDLAVRAGITFGKISSLKYCWAHYTRPDGSLVWFGVEHSEFDGDAKAASRMAIFGAAVDLGRFLESEADKAKGGV